ncbi:MAG: hypothetical protein JO060_05305 [Candidatus Eremiobacteraeota bacterium]|nr:hypothetical protein [Candidatus Eremiobacteraeota bacterium]
MPSTVEWLEYSPFVETAYFYAFDVPAWSMQEFPARGDLVDLAQGPQPFRSPRVLAQQACLIRADQEKENGTLNDFLVAGTPLQIARPWTSSMPLPSVDDVFPSPAVDSWFNRFLSVPMILVPETDTGTATLRRPLPVMAIRGATPKYNGAVTATESYFAPALLHKALRGGPESSHAMPDVRNATPILIEAPVFVALPAADSDRWNHDLLHRGIDDRVPFFDVNGKECGLAGLRDTLFQFSTLEVSSWSESSRRDGTPFTRGIRVIRDSDEFTVYLILQESSSATLAAAGAVRFRFDATARRFVWSTPSAPTWKPFKELDLFGKPFFVALHFLRVISTTPNAQAFPSLFTDAGNGYNYIVRITAGDGRLIHVADPHGDADAFVVRSVDGEPFTHATGGALQFQSELAFADVSGEAIRDAIATEWRPAVTSSPQRTE